MDFTAKSLDAPARYDGPLPKRMRGAAKFEPSTNLNDALLPSPDFGPNDATFSRNEEPPISATDAASGAARNGGAGGVDLTLSLGVVGPSGSSSEQKRWRHDVRIEPAAAALRDDSIFDLDFEARRSFSLVASAQVPHDINNHRSVAAARCLDETAAARDYRRPAEDVCQPAAFLENDGAQILPLVRAAPRATGDAGPATTDHHYLAPSPDGADHRLDVPSQFDPQADVSDGRIRPGSMTTMAGGVTAGRRANDSTAAARVPGVEKGVLSPSRSMRSEGAFKHHSEWSSDVWSSCLASALYAPVNVGLNAGSLNAGSLNSGSPSGVMNQSIDGGSTPLKARRNWSCNDVTGGRSQQQLRRATAVATAAAAAATQASTLDGGSSNAGSVNAESTPLKGRRNWSCDDVTRGRSQQQPRRAAVVAATTAAAAATQESTPAAMAAAAERGAAGQAAWARRLDAVAAAVTTPPPQQLLAAAEETRQALGTVGATAWHHAAMRGMSDPPGSRQESLMQQCDAILETTSPAAARTSVYESHADIYARALMASEWKAPTNEGSGSGL
ncbi:hypothetical protein CLOM_g19352 [Closterium sp. NIES-68]|nr:hypothetical protein CLOM_g19352 [Closterium sp. NIES-68]GJP76850.1 hypothetical protein CLOP_g7300 [Closterium sp. NIES-67]